MTRLCAARSPILAGLLVMSSTAAAHEFKLESTMTGFVDTKGDEAHLVIRVPFHVLRGIKFPLVGAQIALTTAGPAVEHSLAQIHDHVVLAENGRRLVATAMIGRLSLPSDRSFDRYDDAVRHVSAPPDLRTGIYADQGFVDAHFTYRLAAPESRLTIRTTMAADLKDYLKLAIRYSRAGEEGRAMVITSRSGTVALDPTWYEAASGFVALGVGHILTGFDHLLFLVCLVLPLTGIRRILGVITAFTVAHSITLLAAAFGLRLSGVWFPAFVETAIATSIVYMALENILAKNFRARWFLTALFGLVHGFGFSYGLQENLQFAGQHLLISLLSFNLGIELGQVIVLALMLPALAFARRYVAHYRIFVIVASAVVAHTAWHWMLERGEVLWKHEWPQLDADGLVTLSRWAVAILLVAGAVQLVRRRLAASTAPRAKAARETRPAN